MKIKRLTKEQLDEGLTLEAVNSPEFELRPSPVQLREGEEPVRLLCVNPQKTPRMYWATIGDGKFVTDGGKLAVFGEKECRIGRARYLLNYPEREKAERREKRKKSVQAQCETWKKEISVKVRECRIEILKARIYLGMEYEHNEEDAIAEVLIKDAAEFDKLNWSFLFEKKKKQMASSLPEMERHYALIQQMWNGGQFAELLYYFGMKRSGKPLLTAHFDNIREMDALMNTFSKDALEEWNGDRFKMLASIEIDIKI
jgi:hypothetical protein